MKRADRKVFIDSGEFPMIEKQTQNRLHIFLEDSTLTQGKTLKKMREAVGLTQQEFAEIFKISQTLVSLWENGRKEPDAYMLLWLAAFYKIPSDKFLLQFGYELPDSD